MSGEVINKRNLVSIGGSSWLSQNGTGVTTSASGTFYIYGPVARVYSYAKKGLLLAVAYTYVSIYARRNGEWVSIGSCNSVRESGDSGSTSRNWYYNDDKYDGLDTAFKVTYSISCNGAGDRGGQVLGWAGTLSMSHASVYSNSTTPVYGRPIRAVATNTGTSFNVGNTPEGNYYRGNKISAENGFSAILCAT